MHKSMRYVTVTLHVCLHQKLDIIVNAGGILCVVFQSHGYRLTYLF